MFCKLKLGLPFAVLALASAAAAALCAQEPAATIRANSNLVVLDVVATDEHQRPVPHLTAADVVVYEDGKPQTVKSWEEHFVASPAKLPQMPKLPPGVFTNFAPMPQSTALTVLLLDKLNTPVKSQMVLRNELLRYLKQTPPKTPVAIFVLTSQLRMLQGFTSDPEVLRQAVNSAGARTAVSHGMANPISGDEPGNSAIAGELASATGGADGGIADAAAALQGFLSDEQAYMTEMRSRYTLDAFNQLGRYLAGFPGRKNVIWAAGSFPIRFFPNPGDENSFDLALNTSAEFHQTMGLMGADQVAVYPMDVRGVAVPPMLTANRSGMEYAGNPSNLMNDQAAAFRETAMEHDAMFQVAGATGGRAIMNTNGLQEAVAQIVEDGTNYYTLTYVPTNRNWKGEYRTIKVKTALKGVNLAYRRGYVADDPNAPVTHGGAMESASRVAPNSAVHLAMAYGAPGAQQILIDADIRPDSNQTEDKVAPGNQGAAGMKGPFRRYDVTFSASARDVLCPVEQDKTHHCSLEFVTAVYSADGALVNLQTNGIEARLPDASYQSALRSGLRYRQQVSVPDKGEYTLRIGVHDVESDRFGSLETRVDAVRGLKPAGAPAAVGTPTQKK
jgi:VWFA-related protein